MAHRIDSHIEKRNKLCRICGSRVLTQKQKTNYQKPTLCETVKSDIFLILGLHIRRANGEKYSKYIYEKCKRTMQNIKSRQSEKSKLTLKDAFTKSDKIWIEYNPNIDDQNCSSCFHCQQLSQGSVATKQPNNPLPNVCSANSSIHEEYNVNSPITYSHKMQIESTKIHEHLII